MRRFPHIRYAAYLKHVQKKNDYPIPWPTPQEISYWFPQIAKKTNARWRKDNKLSAMKGSSGQAAYSAWFNDRIRRYLTVAIVRQLADSEIYATMKTVFKISSKTFLSVYKNVFFDVKTWSLDDFEDYQALLEGDDHKFFRLACSNVSLVLVLKELGIQVEDVQYINMLKDILTGSYDLWQKNPKDMSVVKAILKVGKELRDVAGTGSDVLEELKTALDNPVMNHKAPSIEELIARQQNDIREQGPKKGK